MRWSLLPRSAVDEGTIVGLNAAGWGTSQGIFTKKKTNRKRSSRVTFVGCWFERWLTGLLETHKRGTKL